MLSKRRRLLGGVPADQSKLVGHGAGRLLSLRQVLEQHGNVDSSSPGGAIECFAVAHQFLDAAVELAGDPAELAGCLVAQLHQMLRDHG